MEIGTLTAQEWPWFLAHSAETGWEQMHPGLRPSASQSEVLANFRAMTTEALQQPGSAVLVAREAGRIAGYIMLTLMPDEWTGRPVGLYYDIWVDPAWRGKGVASLLTHSSEQYFRNMGIKLIRRFIAAHNQESLRHAQKDGCIVERLCLIKQL
jgi:GNAT superfamily N-acetyltransferase